MSRTLHLLTALLITTLPCIAADSAPVIVPDITIAKSDPAYGCAKNVPVYVQQWHIWWGLPFPDPLHQPSHLSSTMTASREPWRLDWDRNGYPLVGIYDSRNVEVIRWQARCMKAPGITAAAVMLHTATADGLSYIQEPGGTITALLDAVAAEGFSVFFMDDVAFMNGKARDPEVMAKRVARFLTEYGNHPAFHHIDGKPVFYYQTFGYEVGEAQTTKMMTDVEKAVGPVHWMIFGDVHRALKIPQVASIVCGASLYLQDPKTRIWGWNHAGQDPKTINPIAHAAGKRVTDLSHVKYENTCQPDRTPGVGAYGLRTGRMQQVVQNSLAAKADFIMLSSWNDYEEGTFLEPAWDFDGFTGDPYTYCRALAALRGIDFVVPKPPAKSAVLPTIWEKLGYGDGAGPLIERVRRTHQRGGSIEVTVRDTMSRVADLEVCWDGDRFWSAPQAGATVARGNLNVPAGSLGPVAALRSPIHPRLTIGSGCEVRDAHISFVAAAGTPTVGTLPAVGVVYALDQANPLAGAQATMRLVKPFADNSSDVDLPLSPNNTPEDVGAEAWEGWNCRVAIPMAAIDDRAPLIISAQGRMIAQVSLLGPPRAERITTAPRTVDDALGLRTTFWVPIDNVILEQPGLHVLWLRARDAAGNWGSPRLFAAPNYEYLDESPKPTGDAAVDAAWKAQTGALLATRFDTNETAWKQIYPERGGVSSIGQKRIVEDSTKVISNAIIKTAITPPAGSAWRLEWSMLHTEAPRSSTLWITDAAGAKGYGVQWFNAGEQQFDGQGEVLIVKLDQTNEVGWNDGGTRLTTGVASGHRAMRKPLARFRLDRHADGRMVLSVDGEVRGEATDASCKAFGSIYLRGNAALLVDDLILTPLPE